LGFMKQLAESFHLEVVDRARPLVRIVGWRTRDSDVEQAYWLQCDKPAARFFLDQNPDYGEGHGLLTLVPLDAASLGGMLSRLASRRARGFVEGVRSVLQRLPVGRYL